MKILICSSQAEWDAFIGTQPGSQFLQSWEWGMFKQKLGQDVVRLAVADKTGKWLAAGQWIYHPKPLFGGFWFAPRGPVLAHEYLDASEDILAFFFKEGIKALSKKRSMFIRCEPLIEYKIDSQPLPSGFIRRHSINPSSTVMLNLDESEEELLSDMHEKTRYNIRLAERKGVSVRVGATDEDIETYLALNKQTAARDAFLSQPDAYIRSTVRTLRDSGMCRIRIAEYKEEVLAANIEIKFGDTTTYLYGASSSKYRNVMAPYALQWSAIRSAKQEGSRFYDLYGANPVSETAFDFKRSWEGITRFKLGWGGARVEFVGTWELPLMPFSYRMMRILRGER